ncbi:MAG TPA: hypothetical protein VEH07_03850 [Alphaproteobacteria bacterium]|nr:hypothetical protein [Alphaproteobacteria bacterium]
MRRYANGTLDGGLPDHADKPVDGLPAIGLLRAKVCGRKHDFTVLRQTRASDALQAQAHGFSCANHVDWTPPVLAPGAKLV